jgi:hypothetical protein
MFKRLCFHLFFLFLILFFMGCDIPTSADQSITETPADPYSGGNHPPVASFPSWDYEVTGAEIDAVNQCYTADGESSFGNTKYSGDGDPRYFLFDFWDNNMAWGIHTDLDIVCSSCDLTFYLPDNNDSYPQSTGWYLSSSNCPSLLNIISVPIDGNMTTYGYDLTATYDFSDSDGDNEGSSIYQWYRCSESTSEGDAISGADTLIYETTIDDLNLYLKIEITPVDEYGFAGTPVKSKATQRIGG